MRPLIMTTVPLPARLTQMLEAEFEICGAFLPLDQNIPGELLPRIRAIVTYGSIAHNAAAMERFKNLSMIGIYGSGQEGINLRAAADRGIVVASCKGANASAAADFGVGLLLASVRRITESDRAVREGAWPKYPKARGLTGSKLGILGLGSVGLKVAARAQGFELEIGYHNRKRRGDVPYAYYSTVLSLAEWADHLMITVRADATNRNIVNLPVLKALGPRGHIVNIARGLAVDEVALIDALESGVIEGAALDVFEQEPMISERLRKLANVTLTSHIASGTVEANEAMQDQLFANLTAHFGGKTVPNPVT